MPPRLFTQEHGYRPIDLLHAATDHLFSASQLFSMGDWFRFVGVLDIDIEAPRCLDSAGYLCHLGVELLLKTFLLLHAGEFPDDRSLARLFRMLQVKGVKLAVNEDHLVTLEKLDEFYELRYPQTAGSPSVGDIDWPRINSLFLALGEQLPEGLRRDLLNLDRTKKFGRVLMRKPKEEPPFQGHVVVDTSKK